MRKIIKLALAGLLSVSTLAVAAESSPEALRIGYQKSNISSVLAKNYQMLEKRNPVHTTFYCVHCVRPDLSLPISNPLT